MSELYRFLDAKEFEDGINRRLLVGQVAVGQVCALRFEDAHQRQPRSNIKYIEAAITVSNVVPIDNGFTRIEYNFDIEEILGQTKNLYDEFNADSLVNEVIEGQRYRAYLTDKPNYSWDDALQAVVANEISLTRA